MAAAMDAAEAEVQVELQALRAAVQAQQEALCALQARLVALEGLQQRERLQHEQQALCAQRRELVLCLAAAAAERRAAQLQAQLTRAAAWEPARAPAMAPWLAWSRRAEKELAARGQSDPRAAAMARTWREVAATGLPSLRRLAAALRVNHTTLSRQLRRWGLSPPIGRGPR